jgi:hypothetical protein
MSERPSCRACDQLMIPSIYDLQTFCHGNPEDCLVYQTKERVEEKSIPEASSKLTEAV